MYSAAAMPLRPSLSTLSQILMKSLSSHVWRRIGEVASNKEADEELNKKREGFIFLAPTGSAS